MALPAYPASPFPLDRTAIVTGAASPRGIGRATARRLAQQGWAVAVVDLDREASEKVAVEIQEQHGVAALGIGADISDRASVDAAVAEAAASLPQIVGLVNNAGISSPVPFLEVTDEEWRRVIEVNLNGTFHITQAAVKIMAEHRVGRIVNVSSAGRPIPRRRRRCWGWPGRSPASSGSTGSRPIPSLQARSTPTSWEAG